MDGLNKLYAIKIFKEFQGIPKGSPLLGKSRATLQAPGRGAGPLPQDQQLQHIRPGL